MGQYIGLLSEILDVINKNQSEVDAYVKIAKRYSGKILELGSGTGCISLELAKEGYDVTCLEIHRDMVNLHKSKLTEDTKNNTTIVLGDMCSFDLNDKFDLIIAPNNVIQHIMNPMEFLEMLVSVKKHLTDVGVFIIESIKPNVEKMKRAHGIEQVNHYKNPKNKNDIEDRLTPFFNFKKQVETQKVVATEFEAGKIKRRVQLLNDNKFWYEKEVKDFINAAGLSVILESGNLHQIEPILEDSEHMIFYIKR